MTRSTLLLLVLAVAVVASALGVVYAKHENRRLFVELQALDQQRDALQVQWGRLQLEHSTWATHERVEGTARGQLDMHTPSIDTIVLVTP